MPTITKRRASNGRAVYVIHGARYRCQIRVNDMSGYSWAEYNPLISVYRLPYMADPSTPYSVAGTLIYKGDDLQRAWDVMCAYTGRAEIPDPIMELVDRAETPA